MKLPIIYACDKCDYKISLGLEDFKKHNKSIFTNLKPDERMIIVQHIINTQANSFLDFYCPKCQQPTTILFNGGDSGYWGEYFFKIDKVLVIKK